MRELQARSDVAHCVHARQVRLQALVDQHPAAIHRYALFLVSHAIGLGATTHGYQEEVRVECLAILERYMDTGVVLSSGGEANTQ